MHIEIEKRDWTHPSIKFVQTILEEVFGYELNDNITMVEEVWATIITFVGLESLFSFFRKLDNEFFSMNLKKLVKDKDFALILHDISIKTDF